MPRRDLDRIRDILLRAEAEPMDATDEFNLGYVDFSDNISPDDAYQLGLLRDAGLVEGKDANLGFFRITSAGHDYIDAIRDLGIWDKTKSAVAETGGSVTLEIVKTLAIGYLKTELEKRTGLKL